MGSRIRGPFWICPHTGNGSITSEIMNAALKEVQENYRKVSATARQIEAMESNEQERLRRIDILQYQIDEIRGVNPGPDEKEELENERNILTNREKILASATEAYGILYESEASILHADKPFGENPGGTEPV